MKIVLLFALVASAFAAADFDSYKKQFGKVYTADEEAMRKANYIAHFEEMEAHNKRYDAGQETWYQAINQFSDMTSEEFQEKVLDRSGWLDRKKDKPAQEPEPSTEARQLRGGKGGTVDWRTKGAVTGVKNQGQCGSCWTFSATGSIEGMHFLSAGKLVSFSEQQIVSCCHVNGAAGCNGGIMDSAFSYIKKFGGLATESSYPYKSGNGNSGRCDTKGKTEIKDVLSGYHDVTSGSATAFAAAVKKNPTSIAVDASAGWQTYGGGVLSKHCGTQLDHGVLAVGYTSEYWIVKNSWATTWGERGYIYLKRDDAKCGENGECGLFSEPSYPTTSGELRDYDDISDAGAAPTTMRLSKSWVARAGAPDTSHYEDPSAGGCQAGEEGVRIQGVQGDFCSPSCASGPCPTDVPAGTTAQPECCLETPGSSKPSRCALICQASSKCPAKATCKMVQGAIGLCTYNS